MNVVALSTPGRDSRLWTADRFLEFYVGRPEGERWQLVDGLAMMMTPPNRVHQKISKNLLLLLDRALASSRPDLEALYEIGVRIAGVDDFNPEPDLIVLPANASFERHAEQFFFVAEVISPSNTAEMVDRKIELYRTHPDNLYCMTIDQDSVHVTLWEREAGWARTDLTQLDDVVRLSAFGFEARLADIYAGTPLA